MTATRYVFAGLASAAQSVATAVGGPLIGALTERLAPAERAAIVAE
ncbi:hypothetical protein [Streptomyces sp. NPDC057301]